MTADLFDDQFLIDPYPTYAYLREQGRIHWTELFGGAWLIPRFADVSEALRDPILSADRSKVPVSQLPEEVQSDFERFDRLFGMWLLFKDPPRHTRLRKLVNHSFTPRVMRAWRPRIEEITGELIERVREKGEVDFLTDFAYELPAAVISEMLGVEKGDRDAFIAWSTDVGIFFGTSDPTLEMAHRAQDGLVSMAEYYRSILPEKRKDPGDDVVSILIRAEEEGEVLTEEEVLSQLTLFLFAGHETTKNLLANGLGRLLNRPDQIEILRDDPSLMHGAVQELLRFDSPIQFLHRKVVEDGELCGAKVEKGQTAVLLVGSANRDADRFTRPDVLDVTRDEGSNLAFGHGPHFCLGAPLTYLEAEIAFPAVFERLPDLELATDELDWDPINPGFRNLKSLPIRC